MIKMRGFFMLNTGLLVFTVLCLNLVIADSHWNYKSEDQWVGKCLTGRKQSPINLQKDIAEYRTFTDFQFKDYHLKYEATLTNNGHSVAVRLLDPRPGPSIKGGGLPYEYKLDHLHFHWESEHTIQSNRYPLELHFVHYANIFNSTTYALKSENGLAVLGVLFDISQHDNPAFEPILDKLEDVKDSINKAVEIDDIIIPDSFLPKDIDAYFRYEGSLTTPSCDESVIWTVFYQHNYISKRQLSDFHTISTEDGPLFANYRSLQNINARTLFFRNAASTISTPLSTITMIICTFYFLKYLV